MRTHVTFCRWKTNKRNQLKQYHPRISGFACNCSSSADFTWVAQWNVYWNESLKTTHRENFSQRNRNESVGDELNGCVAWSASLQVCKCPTVCADFWTMKNVYESRLRSPIKEDETWHFFFVQRNTWGLWLLNCFQTWLSTLTKQESSANNLRVTCTFCGCEMWRRHETRALVVADRGSHPQEEFLFNHTILVSTKGPWSLFHDFTGSTRVVFFVQDCCFCLEDVAFSLYQFSINFAALSGWRISCGKAWAAARVKLILWMNGHANRFEQTCVGTLE